MWVGVRIACNLRDGIKGALRRLVIAQHPVSLANLLQRADGVGFGPGTMPHFLAFNEKRVPMIVMRVGAEDPVVSLRGRNRHRGFRVGSNIHASEQKTKQNMRVSSILRIETYNFGGHYSTVSRTLTYST